MKLLFKQRFFSWFDSYDIYSEAGETLYTVRGEFAWGHQLRVYDAQECPVGCVKQKLLTWLPKYEMYIGDQYVGCICKEFSFFHPRFTVECNGWQVEGDWFEWDYTIVSARGFEVARVTKELWNWTDTYAIEVSDPRDALCALMLVLAIDADKCSRDNH